MKIHIWNAFASNNSGSYTIVGSFPSEAVATQVAEELSALMQAQTDWYRGDARTRSPLSLLVAKSGIDWELSRQTDEWPQYGDKAAPEVVALGHQVLIYHAYTVTLPQVFGHYFYRRGGAVDTRLNHTHGSLCAVFGVWWGWDDKSRKRKERDCAAICTALADKQSAFAAQLEPSIEPAWQIDLKASEYPLTIGAVFRDLVVGCEAVRELLANYPCHFRVKIVEPWPGQSDPLSFLR